jgi:hypothetical protein
MEFLRHFRHGALAIAALVCTSTPAGADPTSDCSALAPTVTAAHQAIITLSAAVATQGDSALSLFGTTRRYGPGFKRVEDEAAVVEQATATAIKASTDGLVLVDAYTDTRRKAIVTALFSDYQKKAAGLQTYSHIALAFERAINSKNRMAHLAADDLAFANMAKPTTTTQSTTSGTASVYGSSTTNGTASGYGNSAYGDANTTYDGTATGSATTTSTTTSSDPGASGRQNAAQAERNSGEAGLTSDQLYPTLLQYLPLVQSVPNTLRVEEARVKRMCSGTDFGDPAFGT